LRFTVHSDAQCGLTVVIRRVFPAVTESFAASCQQTLQLKSPRKAPAVSRQLKSLGRNLILIAALGVAVAIFGFFDHDLG
jgi:hypothetical protein